MFNFTVFDSMFIFFA